ncbi:hypothetical protein CPT_Moonbeam212 [Bacillus phage Moonbeam]|uniref:Uncharacterized protein n=1 Tax=Bacillus phage Moonbeam TaxID=1540091 RepID=A0A0A0RND4_9CAUD|nr:hypothetical protein CPT_Moonbeam212 [Bacillus phage Moonbeam]AIW03610.1 hypothetical protein CPT_Moonbeam212 [Bacillus phage Moonbeam]
MYNEERDIAINDAFVNVYDRCPTQEEINEITDNLPAHVVEEAMRWGWNDTPVGDAIFRYIQANKIKHVPKEVKFYLNGEYIASATTLDPAKVFKSGEGNK